MKTYSFRIRTHTGYTLTWLLLYGSLGKNSVCIVVVDGKQKIDRPKPYKYVYIDNDDKKGMVLPYYIGTAENLCIFPINKNKMEKYMRHFKRYRHPTQLNFPKNIFMNRMSDMITLIVKIAKWFHGLTCSSY